MNPVSGEITLRERLAGDAENVLAEEFVRYRSHLWRMVQFRLDPVVASRVDADDVLQEAWIAALQRVGYFIENESLSMLVWLRLIVGQTIVDLHRHHLGAEMRDAYREVGIGDGALSRSTAMSMASRLLDRLASPSQVAMRNELARQLETAIEGMDPIDREILALRHFEELGNSEVAEVLGIEQKAASIRYVRAVKRLKAILQELPGGDDGTGDDEASDGASDDGASHVP
jgi:RNA polymerase sigma-70 factor (ECF subfamily)